jgi:hypothetical protein
VRIAIADVYEPDLRRDNETKEVIDYKNYNEWLENKEIITPTESKQSKVFGKTNMEEMVGRDNYSDFLESFDSIQDKRVRSLLIEFGDQLSFKELSNSKSYRRRRCL